MAARTAGQFDYIKSRMTMLLMPCVVRVRDNVFLVLDADASLLTCLLRMRAIDRFLDN